jgi:hypothetical protein
MIIWILVAVLSLAGIITIVFAFRGSNSPEEDVNAIYTNAALTVEAQQLTLSASQPSATPTATLTATPFLTNTPFAIASLPSLAAFATNTQSVSVAVGCDNSVYISDVTIPDNTAVTPGQSMTKTWKVQNNGTCAWTATYKITFVTGNAMGGVATAIGQAVSPGQSVDISVAMVAPTAAGDASGTWRLTNDKAQAFGTPLTIVIKVGGTTGGTATRTVTPGGNTSTPTATLLAPPAAVTNLVASTKVCDSQAGSSVTVTWQDNSNNENGFNIYANGTLHGTVGPNFTTYSIPQASFGESLKVIVEAFNNAGGSKVEIDVCP